MNHSEVCPLCKGSAKINVYVVGDYTSTVPLTATCDNCGGQGWVAKEQFCVVSYPSYLMVSE